MNMVKRSYRMGARAESAAETHRRILAALQELAVERFLDEITLDDVAQRAGVTTRTVIRRFGSREALVEAAFAEGSATVQSRLDETPVGDVEDAVAAAFADYERNGDALIMMLAQESRHPGFLGPLADAGRRSHRRFIERVFVPRDRLQAAQLIAATDVYVWKLLRRDMGLGRDQAMKAMTEMVRRLV